MRAIILTGVSAASSKRTERDAASIDVIPSAAHFSRGAKNKRAFNESPLQSSARSSQRSPTPNSSSQRAVASVAGWLSGSQTRRMLVTKPLTRFTRSPRMRREVPAAVCHLRFFFGKQQKDLQLHRSRARSPRFCVLRS